MENPQEREKLLLLRSLDTINNRPQISIPAPKFEQYQLVTLYWNNEERFTNITRRWFDADDYCWRYETTVDQPQLYAEGSIEPRND